jgi:hypothetical protein
MIPPAFRPGGPGRPRAFGHLFTASVDDEMDAAIRAYAQRNRCTLAEALRDLIEYGLESANAEA